MTPSLTVLDFYAESAPMTAAGQYAAQFDELPAEVGEIVDIIQRLLIYDVVASDFYGIDLPEERGDEIHLRPIAAMIERLMALDAKPLSAPRSADRRLAGRCRDYTIFLVSILRAKGIPARARIGFGAYFNPGYFEDHQVCEYWNQDQQRWVLVDAQLDDIWHDKLGLELDNLDVHRDEFVAAGDAWRKCRSGEADPGRFGIEFVDLRGLWFVAGSLVRDLAALNKVETLPWDAWGAQPPPDHELDDDQLAYFDELAQTLRDPDASFDSLRRSFAGDEGLRVPAKVFNALLDRPEDVFAS
jgi:hypothetical protein